MYVERQVKPRRADEAARIVLVALSRLVEWRRGIYSEGVDATVAAMGLTILKTPVRAPQANAHCERLIGTIRRQCLDWLLPIQ